jgi:hypothetical protein
MAKVKKFVESKIVKAMHKRGTDKNAKMRFKEMHK